MNALKALWDRHKTTIIVVALVLAAGGGYGAFRMWDYTQNDPNFCTSCHLMDDAFGRWQQSGHKDVNCHTCHPGDIQSNLHQLWVTVMQGPTQVVKHAEVPAEICGGCHLSNDEKWKQIGETAGHKIHWGEHEIECVTCHAPEVHQFVPTDEMCAKCHADQVVGLTGMQKQHCTSCHNYLGTKSDSLIPTMDDCGRCHFDAKDSPLKLDVAWHGGFECSECHPVHDPVAAVAAGAFGPQREGRAVPCGQCHEAQAVPLVEPPEAHQDCTTCHVPHAPPDIEPRCRDCHEDKSERLPVRDHHACTDCHLPHAPESTPAEICADCHRETETIIAATPVVEHQTCDACHDPHDAEKPDAPKCGECHETLAAKVRRAETTAHRQCQSCHQVHDPTQASSCVRCHRDERAEVVGAPREHRRCQNCHAQHGQVSARSGACDTCHADIVKAGVGAPREHLDCGKCHAAHRPQVAIEAPCAQCHEVETQRVAQLPADHRACTNCHAWHDATPRAPTQACGDCHQEVQQVMAAGGAARVRAPEHRACGNCHRPHRENQAKACGDCHVEQASAARKAKTREHRDCASCHGGEKHGVLRAAPPNTCGDCHRDIGTKGLHAVAEHGACLDCHTPHDVQIGGRAACVACHEKPDAIKDHPKEAKGAAECKGCHVFR